MDKNTVLDLLDAALNRFEECGLIVKEDIQPVYDQLGINRTLNTGDNVVHAMVAVHLAVLRELMRDEG